MTTRDYYIQEQMKFAKETRHPALLSLPAEVFGQDFDSLSNKDKKMWDVLTREHTVNLD